MLKELFFIWIVTATGVPVMHTGKGFADYTICEKEILRLERKYYLDRGAHKKDIYGNAHHMKCLTNTEVINKLNEFKLDKIFGT